MDRGQAEAAVRGVDFATLAEDLGDHRARRLRDEWPKNNDSMGANPTATATA